MGIVDEIRSSENAYKSMSANELERVISKLQEDYVKPRGFVMYTGFIGSVVFNYAMQGLTFENAPNIHFGSCRGKQHYRYETAIPHTRPRVFTLGTHGSLYKVMVKNNRFVYYKGTVEKYTLSKLTPRTVTDFLKNY